MKSYNFKEDVSRVTEGSNFQIIVTLHSIRGDKALRSKGQQIIFFKDKKHRYIQKMYIEGVYNWGKNPTRKEERQRTKNKPAPVEN